MRRPRQWEPLMGRWRSSPVRRGAPGAASPQSSARPECGRPVTIEETAELIEAEGGTATAIGADHLDVAQVRAVVDRIDREHGRLDVLVNDIWGGEGGFEWDGPLVTTGSQRAL